MDSREHWRNWMPQTAKTRMREALATKTGKAELSEGYRIIQINSTTQS